MKIKVVSESVVTRLLFYIVVCSKVFSFDTDLAMAQDSDPSDAIPAVKNLHNDAIHRKDFFAAELLSDKARVLSEKLLLQALDSEAFYTLVGQIKPVSGAAVY